MLFYAQVVHTLFVVNSNLSFFFSFQIDFTLNTLFQVCFSWISLTQNIVLVDDSVAEMADQ
jgi:hypothetical protein